MRKLSNQGFTLVEGLLIVIALSLVVGVGYYVYNANQDKKDTSEASQNVQTEMKSKEQAKKYLEIKELGIKFENSKVPGAYYKIESFDDNFPEAKAVRIYDSSYDKTLNTKNKKCGDVKDDPGIAYVQVISISDRDSKYPKYKNSDFGPTDEVPLVVSDKYAKKSNGYLYVTLKAQGVQSALYCVIDAADSDDDFVKVDELNENVNQAYKESYSKIEEMTNTLSGL